MELVNEIKVAEKEMREIIETGNNLDEEIKVLKAERKLIQDNKNQLNNYITNLKKSASFLIGDDADENTKMLLAEHYYHFKKDEE